MEMEKKRNQGFTSNGKRKVIIVLLGIFLNFSLWSEHLCIRIRVQNAPVYKNQGLLAALQFLWLLLSLE